MVGSPEEAQAAQLNDKSIGQRWLETMAVLDDPISNAERTRFINAINPEFLDTFNSADPEKQDIYIALARLSPSERVYLHKNQLPDYHDLANMIQMVNTFFE